MSPEQEAAREAWWESQWHAAARLVARDAPDLLDALGLVGNAPPYMGIDVTPDPGKNLARTVNGVFYE